jgi:tetratricopeptide (TPR) repeat protein
MDGGKISRMSQKTLFKPRAILFFLLVALALTPLNSLAETPSARHLCRMIRLLNIGMAHDGAFPHNTPESALTALIEYSHAEAESANYQAAIDGLDCLIRWQAFPDHYVLRGQMHLGLYQWDQALADFTQAIQQQPHHAPYYYQRGVLYYSILQTGLETRPAALADFEQALNLDPTGPYAAQSQAYIESIQTELAILGE